MWFTYAKNNLIQVEAQSLGGLGPPGGAQFFGFSLGSNFGGPRWYPLQDDDNLMKFIKNQFRYNPGYVPIGEAEERDDREDYQVIAEFKDIFFGKDPRDIKVIAIPDGKEEACILLLDEKSGEFRAQDLPLKLDDIVKEIKNWKFVIKKVNDKWQILGRKINVAGDRKGIFELNDPASTPGFGYIWRDGPSVTPSNNRHGDLTDNLWENWKSVDSPGGVVGFR